MVIQEKSLFSEKQFCSFDDSHVFNFQISTLSILNLEDNSDHSDDKVFTNRQTARLVCVALKRYFEAHMAIKADQVRRTHLRNEGGGPLAEIPAYKVIVCRDAWIVNFAG